MITSNDPAILSRLEGVRKTADGWQARCPAHDDQNASLAISAGDDGRLLLFCHANCETANVVRAIGLTLADLMPKTNGNGKSFGRIEATYNYRDETGNLLFQAVRFVPKDFRQRAPDGNGGWTWKTSGIRKVLFRLPELLAADPDATVCVVEGEKDVERLADLGLVATCNVGGAGKWRKEYSESLRGRRIVILPDNDDPGRKHAAMATNSLLGIAASVKVVELSGLPEHGDASDWLDAGGTVDALEALIAAAPEAVKESAPQRSKAPTVVVSAEATDLRAAAGRTDAANAARIRQMSGADLRWCDKWKKWLVWDGQRWSLDAACRIDAIAKEMAQAVWRQVGILLPTLDPSTAKEATAFARMTASAKGIAAAQSLARSEPGIAITVDALDVDPWALNVRNGTVNLQTGELRPHDRADLLTKLCPIRYEPAATCPTWEAMLTTIMAGNADLITFMQRAIGYSLTGNVTEQVLFLLYGKGANGKSTFLSAAIDVLGPDYAMQAPDGLLMAKHGESHPTERADLFGKRFVSSVEVEDGRRFAESLVKSLTGGDAIRARRMREDHWQFWPTHKLWLAANHKPVIRGTDCGIWRRVKLIPFTVTIADDQQDKDLPDKLKAERAGILAWAVRGCLDWQRHGLGEPAEVRAATAEYRGEMDVVGAFVADCCIEGSAFTAKAADVYAAYGRWCQRNGEHAVNQRRFGLAINERGIERYTSNGTWYRGLGLATDGTEGTDADF